MLLRNMKRADSPGSMGTKADTPASKWLRSHKPHQPLSKGEPVRPFPSSGREGSASGVDFFPHFLHHLVRSKQIHDRCKKPAHSPAGREAEVPVGKGAQMTVRPISPQEEEDGGHEKGTQLGQNRELLNILGGMRQMPVEFGHLGVQAIDRQMGVKPRKQQDGMDDEHKLDGPGRLSGEKVHAFSPSFPRRLIKRIRPGSCMEPGLEASDESQILDSRGDDFSSSDPCRMEPRRKIAPS